MFRFSGSFGVAGVLFVGDSGQSRRGSGAQLIFALVLVASWKAPEPHVAEPMPVWLIDCGACGAQVGIEIEIVFGFLLCYWAARAVRAFVFWLGFPVSLATSLGLVSSD